MTVIASHVALTGSPMSAATAAMGVILAYPGAQADIMKLCIPAGLAGVLAGCVSVLRMGKELDEDPEFLEKMKDPAFAESIDSTSASSKKQVVPGAKTAVIIFSFVILLVVLFGSIPALLPNLGAGENNIAINADGRLKMGTLIEILTLSASALILFLTKTKPAKVLQSSLFTAMAAAVVSVFGVVWMSATFIQHNEAVIKAAMGDIASSQPWTFTFAIFIMASLIFSQAATTRAMMPLGLTLGISHPHLMAMFPAVNSDFVLPGYPTLLAAINFDRTGTTRIGRWVLNHSFMRGGLVTIAAAVAIGFLLSRIML